MFSKCTKLQDIEKAFPEAKGSFISGGDFFTGENTKITLQELQDKHPTWFTGDILYGLERLGELAKSKEKYIYSVYSDDLISQDPRLEKVKLFYLPAKKKKYDTYAILSAGGAYGAVCTMVESLPVAAKLNDIGITCFCLNYRVADEKSFPKGLMPDPIDDLAAAINFIRKNNTKFDVDPENYIAGGFSAGGHLTSQWGTPHLGAAKYKLPPAKALVLVYPLITIENVPDGPVKDLLCKGMFGTGYTLDDIRLYDASLHIDDSYPKTYIVRAEDDITIAETGIEKLISKLEKHNITCRLEQSTSGGHGFGLGSATPLKNWVEHAISFMNWKSL